MKWAYYNDNDAFCCEWLRNLIKAGHIPEGEVDGRPIQEVNADELQGFRQVHFFAGVGGWAYALRLAGWPPEEPVWTGSCPCQPYSQAGKGKGDDDPRNLWPVWRPLIAKCRPSVVFGEQVASKAGRGWLAGVRADLEVLEYALGAADLCAASVGAPHRRHRLFWVADANRPMLERQRAPVCAQSVGHQQKHWQYIAEAIGDDTAWPRLAGCSDVSQPMLQSGSDGLSARVGRLRACGNAVVPQVAAEFIQAYREAVE